LVVVFIALLFIPRRVLADDAPAPAPAHAPAPAPAPATDAAMIEGRKHFLAGVSLIEDPDGARYEEAYHAFQKAYALSRSPKVLGNIGLCSLKLERDGEAIDAYTAYLRESPDVHPEERAQIERDLNTLSSNAGVVRVIVTNPAGSYVVVDSRQQTRGAPVLNSYSFQGSELTLRLRPGRHTLKVKSSSNDAESAAWELTVEPGARVSHEMKLVSAAAADKGAPATQTKAESSTSGPSYVGPVVLGVLGVAGLGVGVTSAFITRSKENELADRCPNQICPSGYDLRSTRTDAKTWATVADVSMIGGGAVLVTAIVWALALPSKSKAATTRTGALTWQPACGAQGCKVQIGGSF
jgi:hypothetical protein